MKIPLRHLITALGLAFTLSAHAAEPAKPASIRIAVPDLSAGSKPSAGGVVDVLRDQQLLEKEFAKDGIRIDWHFFKGAGPVVNEALANGQADFAYLGDLAAIVGKANGLDTRVLSAGVRGVKSYLGVVPGSGIKTLHDLKGKRVAVFRGTANQLSFASALASQGLSERELKVINLDFNAANAALAAKQIDATWGLSNLLSLRERGLVELPVNSRDLEGAGSTQAVLLGAGDFIRKYPELVQRLMLARTRCMQQQQAVHRATASFGRTLGMLFPGESTSFAPPATHATARALQDPELNKRWVDQGYVIWNAKPADLADRMRREHALWAEVTKGMTFE